MNQSTTSFFGPSVKFAFAALCFVMLLGIWTQPVFAYSCKASYEAADRAIAEAEGLLGPKTDVRILALIEKAKGINAGSKVSHDRASERHTGRDGKYMHGDSMRMSRTALAMANEAIFLASGQPR